MGGHVLSTSVFSFQILVLIFPTIVVGFDKHYHIRNTQRTYFAFITLVLCILLYRGRLLMCLNINISNTIYLMNGSQGNSIYPPILFLLSKKIQYYFPLHYWEQKLISVQLYSLSCISSVSDKLIKNILVNNCWGYSQETIFLILHALVTITFIGHFLAFNKYPVEHHYDDSKSNFVD